MSIGKKFYMNFTNMALVLVLGTAMFSAGCGDDKTVNYYTGGASTTNPSDNNNPGDNSGDKDTDNPGDKDPNSGDKDPNSGDNNNPGGTASNDGKYVKISVAADSLPANVTNIQYIYSDSEGNQVGKSDSETIDRTSSNTTVEDKDAPSTAVKIIIVYLDKDGNLVASDERDIDWSQDENGNTTGTVESSDPTELDKDAKLVLKADKYAVKPSEKVQLTCLLLSDDGSSIDVTNLASFGNVYSDVLKGAEGGARGQYEAVGYKGKHGGVADKISVTASTPSGEQTVQIDKPVYVTDQDVESIRLAPADINGKAITVNDSGTPKNYTDDYSVLVYVPEVLNDGTTVHQTFNQKVGTFDLHGTGVEVDAINEQPMSALASYTNVDSKGPSPSDVDVTSQTKFSAEIYKYSSSAKTYYTVDVEGNVIKPKLDPSYLTNESRYDRVKVTGNYSTENGKVTTSTFILSTKLGWAHTAFAIKRADGTYKPISYELNEYVYRKNHDPGNADYNLNCAIRTDPSTTASQKLYLKGVICVVGKTFCCDIPEELLPADSYPSSTSGGAGISSVRPTLKQVVSGRNEYLFEVLWDGYSSYDHAYLKLQTYGNDYYKAFNLPSHAAGEIFYKSSSFGRYVNSAVLDIP